MEEYVKAQQRNLNAAGFKDYEGKTLAVDGVPGKRTYSAQAKRDVAAADSGGASDSHKHKFNGVTGVPV